MHRKQSLNVIFFIIFFSNILCQEAPDSLIITDSLKNIETNVESPPTFTCWWDNCSKQFASLDALKNHLYAKHGNKNKD